MVPDFSDLLVTIVSTLLLSTALAVFSVAESRKQKRYSSSLSFCVTQPKLAKLVGILITIGTFAAFCYNLFLNTSPERELLDIVIYIPLFFLGLSLVFYTFRWKVAVVGTKLIYTPPVGREKTIPIEKISHCKIKSEKIAVYSEKKRIFSMETFVVNRTMMLDYLRNKGVKITH